MVARPQLWPYISSVSQCSSCIEAIKQIELGFARASLVKSSAGVSFPFFLSHDSTCIKDWLLTRKDCPYCRRTVLPIDSIEGELSVKKIPELILGQKLRTVKCFYCLDHQVVFLPPSTRRPILPEETAHLADRLQARSTAIPDRKELSGMRGCHVPAAAMNDDEVNASPSEEERTCHHHLDAASLSEGNSSQHYSASLSSEFLCACPTAVVSGEHSVPEPVVDTAVSWSSRSMLVADEDASFGDDSARSVVSGLETIMLPAQASDVVDPAAPEAENEIEIPLTGSGDHAKIVESSQFQTVNGGLEDEHRINASVALGDASTDSNELQTLNLSFLPLSLRKI